MINKLKNSKLISVADLAEILKISRVAVFKKIQKGQIPAEKVGRSYVISMEDVDNYLNDSHSEKLTDEKKEEIKKAVEKTVEEYGETLRMLGKE